MFASWMKFLPYGLVVFLAKQYCERFSFVDGNQKTIAVVPFKSREMIGWIITEENESFSE
ncbi:hypothetical protein EVB81_022 [Rhizobium phage RHph_I46]|uniref:Uncharacterized protein n=1 Tax=Rhizobium phage RHph_I1_9 TaxID=2509729 RepID=A0A7S5RII7_9CAUD|nr:hypothetical protein PP936_gp022 [Rhizobium phage RHph_I1_9]QIG69591.1 hypothetical protein EVB81_022 [Rhizobium phage RHph_I46]QIG70872.1 hypothetical protein EVB92_022 [Rhizobium phage RHph_I9]QIG73459.1 hypothetical protein EVC04_022 [Rhizobium phage RHph_I1_9]QIG76211.1 hypothetical protein EVC25_022 [Rhizobium phage RHph_I34]